MQVENPPSRPHHFSNGPSLSAPPFVFLATLAVFDFSFDKHHNWSKSNFFSRENVESGAHLWQGLCSTALRSLFSPTLLTERGREIKRETGRRKNLLPSFFVPTAGHLAAQVSHPRRSPGICQSPSQPFLGCHATQKNG